MRFIELEGTTYKISFRHVTDYCADYIRAKTLARQLKQINDYATHNEYKPLSLSKILGITICELSLNKKTYAIGFAFCSKLDQFNKKIGRRIALNRAIKNFNQNKDRVPFSSFIYGEKE